MNSAKSVKVHFELAILNFVRAISANADLPQGGRFIARPNPSFLDLCGW